jgi:hypothetical protein
VTGSTALLTYLWHYVVARTVYDDLLRPVLHGHVSRALPVICALTAAFAIGRLARRRT